MKKKIIIAVLAFLTIAAIFLRFYRFEGHVMFLSDQGRDARIVRDIVTLKNLPLIGAPSSVGQVYLGPLYYYLISPFLLLFNFNPVGLAFAVAVIALSATAWFYLRIRRDIDLQTALLFLTLSVFSATLIEFARFSWNPNLLPFFGFGTLLLFHDWLKEMNWKRGVLFGFVFGLTMQLHYLAVFLGIPIMIMYIYTIYADKSLQKNWKHTLTSLGIAITSFASALSPLIVFDLKHNFLNFNQFVKLFTEGGLSTTSAPYSKRVLETIAGFIEHSMNLPNSPLNATLMLVGIVGLAIVIAKERKSSFIMTNILALLGYILGFAYLGSPRYAHYFGPIFLCWYFLLVVQPLYFAKVGRWISTSVIVIFFVVAQISGYFFLTQEPNDQIGHARRVSTFMKEKIGNEPTNIATWPVSFGEDSYVYFLENDGVKVADRTTLEITDQLFVICGEEPCEVLNSPSWNISMFGPAKIIDSWSIEGLQIIKLVHSNQEESTE